MRSGWGYNCIYGGVGGLISRVHVDRTAKPARRDGTEYRPTSLPRRLMGGTLGLPIIGLECPPGNPGIYPAGWGYSRWVSKVFEVSSLRNERGDLGQGGESMRPGDPIGHRSATRGLKVQGIDQGGVWCPAWTFVGLRRLLSTWARELRPEGPPALPRTPRPASHSAHCSTVSRR